MSGVPTHQAFTTLTLLFLKHKHELRAIHVTEQLTPHGAAHPAHTSSHTGIASSKTGYIFLEYKHELRAIYVTEQLTLEALLARLQARKPAPPLYLHASLSEVVSVSRPLLWKGTWGESVRCTRTIEGLLCASYYTITQPLYTVYCTMHSICMCYWYRVCPVQASDTSASAAVRQVKQYAKASELPCKTYGSTQSDPAEVGDVQALLGEDWEGKRMCRCTNCCQVPCKTHSSTQSDPAEVGDVQALLGEECGVLIA